MACHRYKAFSFKKKKKKVRFQIHFFCYSLGKRGKTCELKPKPASNPTSKQSIRQELFNSHRMQCSKVICKSFIRMWEKGRVVKLNSNTITIVMSSIPIPLGLLHLILLQLYQKSRQTSSMHKLFCSHNLLAKGRGVVKCKAHTNRVCQ